LNAHTVRANAAAQRDYQTFYKYWRQVYSLTIAISYPHYAPAFYKWSKGNKPEF
jgi:hypothetical protein